MHFKNIDPFNWVFILLPVFCITGCIEQTDLEVEQPKLELISPTPCDTLYFGESFTFSARIIDNTGLGNLSMDIHHNFGHHDHGLHESCILDAEKQAVNPFTENWVFALPDTATDYILNEELVFPATDEEGILDVGDYHFHFYVTDIDGYQVFTTMDLKLLNP